MTWMLVTYRTTDYRYKMYAVVPAMWVSDLVEWLKLSESAEIVSVTDNPVRELPGISAFRPPGNWPSYRACERHIQVSDLVRLVR